MSCDSWLNVPRKAAQRKNQHIWGKNISVDTEIFWVVQWKKYHHHPMEKSMYKGCWSLQSWHRPFKKPWLLNFLQKHVQQLDGPKHCRRKTGLQCLGRSSFCWVCSLTCASFTFPSRFPAQMLVLPGMFKHDLWGNMLKVCYMKS